MNGSRANNRVTRAGLLLVGAGLLLAPAASAHEIYVSPKGDDASPGTIERPFATLQRAQRAVRERAAGMTGDIVVNLRAGTYRLRAPLRLTAADSGRNGHRVIYQAYPHERVVVSGGRRITRWHRAGRGLWRAPVGRLNTRQLYVDGRRATRATRSRGLAGHPGLPGKVRTTRSGYVTDSTVPQAWRRPQDIELVYASGFSEGRCGVAGISGDAKSTRITMDQPCWRRTRRLYGDEYLPTGVENSPSFLTKPGTWYLDRTRHMLLCRGKDPRRAEVIASVLETLIGGEGVHDVSLRGLTLSHATWLGPSKGAGFPGIFGNEYYAGGPLDAEGRLNKADVRAMPGNVVFHAAQRINIEGNRFTHLGSQALELTRGSADNLVRGNVVSDISGGGIWIGAEVAHLPDPIGGNRNNRVESNWVHDVALDYRAAFGIGLAHVADTTVVHNQVNDTPYSGIVYLRVPDDTQTRRVQVLDNRVFNTNNALYDGGGIYGNARQGDSFETGALVRGNVVSDTFNPLIRNRKAAPVPIGIYTDDFSDWISVHANVVYRSHRAIGGVKPKRVRYVGNFWDYAKPGWDPPRHKPKEVAFTGNTLLPEKDPRRACRAIPACAAILANAGLEPAYRGLLR